MRCPIHKDEKLLHADWEPPAGLDPKMTKHACQWCQEYWYKTPLSRLKRWWEIHQTVMLALTSENPHYQAPSPTIVRGYTDQ